MEKEPVAWWILTSVLILSVGIAGYFVKSAYRSVIEAIKDISKTLEKILESLARQQEKNKYYTEQFGYIWEELHSMQKSNSDRDKKALEMEKTCELCQANAIRNKK